MKKRPKGKLIAVVGTGLIGASIGLALRRAPGGLAIVGWDPNRRHLSLARRLGALDRAAAHLQEAVNEADVIVLAAPIRAVVELLPGVAKAARPGSLVLDVAGLKRPVGAAAARALRANPGVLIACAHPMAGNEGRGPAAASAELFLGRPFALYVPAQPAQARARFAARRFARWLGAVPIAVEPRVHDEAVAATSALPQLAAVALALAVADAAPRRIAAIAGPGLRDATRLAETSFSQWEDGLLDNARNVRRALRALVRRLVVLDSAILRGDARTLARLFRAAARARGRFVTGARGN